MKQVFLCALLLSSVALFAADNPRIYIEDSQSWEIKGGVGGSDDGFGGGASGGARPQTAEIIKTFSEKCSSVVVNNRREKADYVVVLQHEGGKDLFRRDNKVVVFNRDGDSILSRSTRSLGNAVNDACNTIMNDWNDSSRKVDASLDQTPTPNGDTQLQVTSTPAGADIEVNGNFVGSTPSAIHLQPGEYSVAVKKDGYTSWERRVKVTGGDINLVAELQKQQ